MAVLFLFSLLPYFYFAWRLSRRSREDLSWGEALAGAGIIGLALLLLMGAILGRALQNLDAALVGGAGFCLVLALMIRKSASREPWQPIPRPRLQRADIPLILLLVFSTVFITLVSVRYAIHDEVRIQGHIPVVQMILAGKFPPTLTAFPEVSLRYHYGFNLLAAGFSKAFALPGYWGIDVAAILSWLLLCSFLLIFFQDTGVPRRGWGLGFALVVLTGGLSWCLARQDTSFPPIYQLPHWQQMFVAHRHIHPNFTLYFFQHPMGLGLVFFLGVLHYFYLWLQKPRVYLLGLTILLLGALSLVQVMLFATLLVSLGMVFFFRLFSDRTHWVRNLLAGLAVGLVAIALAYAMGGFFQNGSTAGPQIRFTWPPGYVRNEYYGSGHSVGWLGALYWYLSGFGLLIFLIPLGVYLALRSQNQILWLLAGFCGLSFLIPQFFQYRYSWDIVKWLFGFEVTGKLLMVATLVPRILQRPLYWIPAWIFILIHMVSPVRFLTELSLGEPGEFSRAEWRMAAYGQPRPSPAMKRLAGILAACQDCYGMVWSSASTSPHLAMFTGFPMVQVDGPTSVVMGDAAKWQDRKEKLKLLNEAPTRNLLAQMGVRWIIFSCREVVGLTPPVKKFLEEVRAMPGVRDHSVGQGGSDCYLALELPASS